MPEIILDAGFLRVAIDYLQKRKSGALYYYRRVPQDLRPHYGGKRFIVQSLKTKQEHVAAQRIAELAARDDAYWATLRSPEGQAAGLTTPVVRKAAQALLEVIGLSRGEGARHPAEAVEVLDGYFTKRYGGDYERARHDETFPLPPETFYSPVEHEVVRLVMEDPSKPRIHLTDALEHYLKHHRNGQQAKFARDNRAYVSRVTTTVGDMPLPDYRRVHANAVRDKMLEAGVSTGTARRTLNAIRAVFNHGLREFDLRGVGNPFEDLPIAGEGHDSEERAPFTEQELKTIARACLEHDDDIRHLVALQADTGARLSEIVGLRIEDVVLNHPVPHILIRPHVKLGRTLKNTSSERMVPLVGMSLWGVQRALEATQGRSGGWLFPRYAKDGDIKATHASNTLAKWLRKVTGSDKKSHSFRHAMRDRLRHVGAPEDIQDAIGGRSSGKSVGRGYGEGYRLEQLRAWLERVVIQ